MAALMLMSCWVFFAPETAWAVNSSGDYTWRLYVNCYNSYTGNEGWYTITGKTNNGRGWDTTIASKWGMGCGSGSIFDKGKDGYYPDANGSASSAFPYKMQAYTYKNSGPKRWPKTDGAFRAELQVKKADGNWVTVCSGDSGKKSGHTDIQVNASGSSNFPVVNSTSWVSAPTSDLTISGGTATVSRAMTFNMFDQYGVRMSSAAINALGKAPTATVSGSRFGTIGTDSSKNIYYAIDNSGSNSYKITVYVKPDAKSKDYDSQTINVNVTSDGKSAGARSFTLYDPQYTFSFNGNGGSISPNASVTKYYYNTLTAEQIPSSGNRTGYEFLGVYADAHLNYAATKPAATVYGNRLTTGTPIERNQTWYAAWWAKNVKVTFVDNMGNVLAETAVGKYDKTFANSGTGLQLPNDVPFVSNTGSGTFNYSFTGNWKVIDAKKFNADGTQAEYQGAYGTSSSSFILKGDTVFQAVYEKAKKDYTVTFYNEDGSVKSEKKDYDYREQASCAPLSKAPDNYFNYNFKGWHKVEYKTNEFGNYITDSNGNYVPADGEQKNAYIVNKNGYLSTSATSDEADAVNRYVSVADDDDFTVRSDAEFIPVFEKTYNEYTVTLSYKTATGEDVYFNNEGRTYHFGDALGLPEVPDSYTTGGYRYPLTGFTKNGAATGSTALPGTLDESVTTHATKEVKYVAVYGEKIPAEYTISFTYKDKDGNDKTETKENVKHDSAVTAPTAPTVPTTYRDAEYEYTFSKWLDQDGAEFKSPAYKDAQYVAQYTAKKLYIVTFMNEGEEFAEKAQYVAGDTIAMPSTNPTKPADKTAYKYTFKEWVDENGTAVKTMPEDNLVLEASYTPSYIDYVINFIWKDKNGNNVTDTKHYHYTDPVTVPNLDELNQTSYKDNTYEYTFKGWDTDVSKHCLGEGEMNEAGTSATLTYTATYRRAYNYYTVKWLQETSIVDGAVVYDEENAYMTDAFIYNEKVRIPTVPPVSVQKPSSTAYSMVLDHWYYVDGEGNKVTIDRDTRITGDIKAYPVYKEAAKVCKVTFFDDNGNALGTRDIAYNTDLETYNGIGAPRKNFSDTHHFKFTGWKNKDTDEKVAVITEDCSLQATYVKEEHTYGEIVADKLPTFFETGLGTQACTGCAKILTNVTIPVLTDDVAPTAKLFIKDAITESGKDVPEGKLLVAPKNNLIVATVDKAAAQTYNESGKGSGTGKIEYFVTEGETATDFESIAGWKLRFDYDEYVAELKRGGLSDAEIKLAMSEFEANATAYVGDLANSYPEIVKDGNTFIFYAKITDRKGNVNYVRSQPLVYDATAPAVAFSGNGNGGSKFCTDVSVIISENVEIASVKVNGEEMALEAVTVKDGEEEKTLPTSTNGKFTLKGKGFYQITVTDVAGNITEKNIEILGKHNEKATVTPATCTSDGATTYTCTVCGTVTKEPDPIEKLGHNLVLVDTVKKTCVDNGYELWRCTRCGETEKKNIQPATGNHTYAGENDGWVVSKKPTCSAVGEKYRVCTVCGEYEFGTIEKDTNAHVWYRGVVTKPTCTVEGYTMHTCKYCGFTEEVEGSRTKALGHEKSGVWVVTKEASCLGYNEETQTGGTVGEKVQYCKRDGAADCNKVVMVTEEIPVPNHEWVFVEKVAPTTETEGYTLYRCRVCGTEKKTTYVPKLVEHTVTFKVGEDVYASETKLSGESVTVDDPTKAADETYKYTFKYWADAEGKKVELPVTVPADKDITLTAVFEATYINYTFVFYTKTKTEPIEDVQFKKVGYRHYDDEAEVFAGPSDYETDGATYKFLGWVAKGTAPILEDVKDEETDEVIQKANVSKSIKPSECTFDADNTAEFEAVFKETVKKVNLTFAYDITSGTYIYTEAFDYGTEIKDINSVIPDETLKDVKKAADDVYHYTFKEWKVREGSESLKNLRKNTLALAVFTATEHNFELVEGAEHSKASTCTEDGFQDYACSCGKNERRAIPAHGHKWSTTPDENGKVECSVCHEKKDYDAKFTVTFYNDKGATIKKLSDLKWNADISKDIPTNVTKESDAQYDYTFAYWYKKGDTTKTKVDVASIVKADAEYVAEFKATPRKYKVIYRLEGSTTALQVFEVEYGAALPEYTGETPKNDKFDDYQHYVFADVWSKSDKDFPDGITQDVVITPVFTPEGHDTQVDSMKNATCTEAAKETYKCTKCGYTYTKTIGKPLGHKYILLETVDPTESTPGYELYKCERCGDTYKKILEPKKYIYFTVTVVDQNGAPVQGATVTVFDGTKFVASGTTDAHGKVVFRVEEAKKYRIVVEYNKQHLESDITVNPDGSITGDVPSVNVTKCSCTCHRNGVWPAIFRFFHKVIKMLVGHFVCCGNPDPRYNN